jgi:protein-tyrosine-phosphatase
MAHELRRLAPMPHSHEEVADPTPAEDRVVRHAALADASRLRVIDALAVSDLSPVEVGRLLDAPSNLVAHHLKVLRQAGLITQVRSEGDGRRTYLRLAPDAFQGLTVAPRWHAERVVFVCRGNSARSQLAEALWRHVSVVPVTSAGTHPADRVHPGALAAARRHHVRLDRPTTRHLAEVLRDRDVLIALCDEAHEELAAAATPQLALHWSIPDPARLGTDEAFDAAFDQIAARIDVAASAHEATLGGRT